MPSKTHYYIEIERFSASGAVSMLLYIEPHTAGPQRIERLWIAYNFETISCTQMKQTYA